MTQSQAAVAPAPHPADAAATGLPPDILGPRPGSVVVFVHDHDEAAAFYRDLLTMEVAVRTSTAALLVGRNGSQLYLRAVGPRAAQPLRHVGTQYVVWTADGPEDFQRCERVLRARCDVVSTRRGEGFTLIEGRDPSGLPVLVAHPGPDEVARHEIISRYYV